VTLDDREDTEWKLPPNLPKRWLIITQYYAPEPGASSVRLGTLVRILSDFGLEVEVLTGMPNYPTGNVPDKYRGKWTYKEVINGIPVFRTWVYGYGGYNKLKRIFNFFSYTASAILNMFRLKRPDIVFVESLPLPVGILGILAKVFWQVPYIYNIPDMQIEVAREMGWMKNRLLLKAAESFENMLIRRSWRVSTVTNKFIEFYHQQRKIPREKLTLLPNGADTRFLKPVPMAKELIQRFGVANKRVFVYAGTHAHYHRLDTIIEAAELIRHRDDIRIVMVGHGPDRQHIIDLAIEKGLENVIFGQSPFDETPQLMSIATAALVVLRNSPVSKRMRLAKTFPPMACGKPVIFSGEGESADLIRENGCGLGRQALVILLRALGVNTGDKVGVCSFTCLSVAEAVKVCGAIPVYLDVDEHLCIEPQEILRQETGSLKVVILQHTFGIPGQLEKLLSACKKIGAKVIEDCAQSLGCFWKGEPLGQFGEGAIYSFQWGKPYTTGQGGILTVNSKELLDEVNRQIEKLALLASIKSELILECQRRIYSIFFKPKYEGWLRHFYFKLRGAGLVEGSFKLDCDFNLFRGYVKIAGETTAKAGLKQLENWPKLKRLRRENTEMIEEYFSKAGLALWPKPDEADVTMLRYPVLTRHKSRIVEQARKHKLDLGGWYISPVHPLQGNDLAKVDYHIGSCKKTEDMISRLVHLPTGPALNKRSLQAMVRIISQN